MSIRKQLVIMSFVVTAFVCSLVFLALKLSLGDGFADYLSRVELSKVQPVATEVEKLYGQNGNWQFVERNPEFVWQRMQEAMAESLQEKELENPPHGPARAGEPAAFHPLGIPPHVMELLHRVAIFDTEKHRIWGPKTAIRSRQALPLASQGRDVGELKLSAGPSLFNQFQENFANTLFSQLAIIAVAILAILLLATQIFWSNLHNAINALLSGTRKIADREANARVDLKRSDELGDLARELNRLAEKLEDGDRARKQWVVDTSHEMRTPIAVLRAQVEAFQDGVQNVTPKTLQVLHGEIMALSKLVDDIHWLGRFDIGLVTPQMVPTDVVSIAQEVMESTKERFESKNIRIDTSELKPSNDLIVNADPSRLRQVLSNFIENSFFYTDAGGKVRIGCRKLQKTDGSAIGAQSFVQIRLDDSEPGVPPELLPHIFDRFFRVDQSRSRTLGGSGLGLAICKEIVESHGGRIEASPSPLGGLRMDIYLPAAKSN